MIVLFREIPPEIPCQKEIRLDDGYGLTAHLVRIPDYGYIVTIQDISYLRELDYVKTDFVNSVSHDPRSPLTAILGYLQLISRFGELNGQKRDFIQRYKSVFATPSLS